MHHPTTPPDHPARTIPPRRAGCVVSSTPPKPVVTVPDAAAVLARHCVTEVGDPHGPVLLLAHGFGAGQLAWTRLLPFFQDHRVVLFDYAGSGGTRLADFDHERHAELGGYAQDLLEVCAALDLRDVHVVAHSVSAMIALLAAAAQPDRFASLALLAPSPATSTTPRAAGSAVSAWRTSTNCWSPWTATTTPGPRRWRRWSWAPPGPRTSRPS